MPDVKLAGENELPGAAVAKSDPGVSDLNGALLEVTEEQKKAESGPRRVGNANHVVM